MLKLISHGLDIHYICSWLNQCVHIYQNDKLLKWGCTNNNQMATSNKLKAKKQSSIQQQFELSSPTSPRKRPKIFTSTTTKSNQQLCEKYSSLSQNNPIGLEFTSMYFPAHYEMSTKYSVPLGYCFSPMLALENQGCEVMNKSVDLIPRCGDCRAYMNCYNQIKGHEKKFVCFFCGSTNYIGEYQWNRQDNLQLQNPVYQALGSKNYYMSLPHEDTIVFLFDLNHQSSTSQLLYYASASINEAFQLEELQQMAVYFFGYDKVLYQFGFDSEEVRCVIVDKTINEFAEIRRAVVKDIKGRLVKEMFEAMQDISRDNREPGGNFSYCFDFMFRMTRSTGAKYFIFQSSQSFIDDELMVPSPKQKDLTIIPKSPFESQNKVFLQKYGDSLFNNGNGISLFMFARGYKNIRSLSDCFKLVNCELKYYSKDSYTELQKFYYELTYLLTATYFKDVRTQFIINRGWAFLAVYGNSHRLKNQFITFCCPQLQSSRKYFVLVSPSRKEGQQYYYCAIQHVVNYWYKQQHFVSISTFVQPVTYSLPTLFSSINHQLTISLASKTFLANLRIQSPQSSRRKWVLIARNTYKQALMSFKTLQNIPDQLIYVLAGFLAMIKTLHSQPEAIINSPLFDRIVAQRNLFQFSGPTQVGIYFVPFLFDLTDLGDHIIESQEFVYPPTIEAKFINIKQGIFLVDNGLNLYLFISKTCPKNIISQLFTQPPTKSHSINQSHLRTDTSLSIYLNRLMSNLREQKCYGWIPLHIVMCGENSQNQRNFYNLFFGERYDGFSGYKGSLQEFLELMESGKETF